MDQMRPPVVAHHKLKDVHVRIVSAPAAVCRPLNNTPQVCVKFVVSAFLCPLTPSIKTLRPNLTSYVNSVPNAIVPSCRRS